MKQHCTLLLIFMMISSVIFAQTISVGKVTSSSPATVNVPVTITGSLANVKSIVFQFRYDKNHATFKHSATDPASGILNFSPTDAANLSVTDSDGLISLSWFGSTSNSLTGKIFDLNFDFLSNFSEIRFESATIKDWSGKKITFDLIHGSISNNTNPAMEVIYPNGGETIEVIGSPTKIIWTCIYIANVNLDYSTDGGSSWQSITANYDATKDYYLWTIPSTVNSTNCKIKITDVLPAATSDESNSSFTINSTPVLTLTTPNGSEELKVGGVKNIKWTFKNILNVKIEYTTNASSGTPVWQTIIASMAAKDASYDWIIPNAISTDCKIRVTDLANPTTIFDLSDAAFKIHNLPISVTVGTVVEGHLKIIGKVVERSGSDDRYWWWQDDHGHWDHEKAKVEKDGETYYASDTLKLTGKVPVTIGWMTSLQYVEMSISFDPLVMQLDSIIAAYPSLGTMSYSVQGNLIHVIWVTTTPIDVHGKIFDLKFRYTKLTKPLQWIDSGWDYDNAPVSDPRNPTATIDPKNFSDLKITMLNAKDSQNNLIDASNWTNGSLSISNDPAVKLLSPVGGEIWEVNDLTQNILWSSRLVTNVAIKYSTNNGSDWTTITTSTSALTGSYSWTLPNINSTNCLVEISKSDDSSKKDVSDYVFTITNIKSINLLSPDGGELLRSGSTKGITWICRNLNNVKLEYSINGDTTWTVISASEPAKNYLYSWTVPVANSEYCRVRISDAAAETLFDKSTNLFTISSSKVKVKIPYLVQPPGNISVPINSEKLYSINYINIGVKYNIAAMTFDDVTCNSALNVGQFNKVNYNGEVRIVWYSTTPIDFSGDLFTIKFKSYSGVFSVFTFSSPTQIKDSFGNIVDAQYVNGNIGTVDVKEEMVPSKFSLLQNYPNPFNPSTSIRYEIPKSTHVSISIYNLLGQKVVELVDEQKLPGFYQVEWNATNYANGIYFYNIRTDDFVQTKKMILLK